MKQLEKRSINIDLSDCKVTDTEGKKYITGIIPYNSKSENMFIGYAPNCEYEILSPTVFNKTISDKLEIYANLNHNDDAILGNTKSGTLELTNTENGLICRCLLPNSDIGNRAFEMVNRGDNRTMSFEFIPYNWTESDGVSTLTSAKLTAVSFCVINPAYKNTDSFASIRSLQKRNINIEKVESAISENKIDTNDKEMVESIKNLSNSLNEIIKTLPENNVEQVKEDKPVVAPEQLVANTKVENTEKINEKLEQLENIEKEIQKEISE